MQKNKYIVLILMLYVFVSCQKQGVQTYEITSGADVQKFVNTNKEKNVYTTKIDNVNFKLTYISKEEMALREVEDLSKMTQASFDSLVKAYDQLLMFNLEVEIDGFNEEMLHYKLDGNAEASFNERVQYYAFHMQKDIHLVLNEKDTIPCSMYHFERNYGISPKNNFMFGFNTATIKNAVVVYNNAYLTTGPVKFALNEQDILNHPQIKIN